MATVDSSDMEVMVEFGVPLRDLYGQLGRGLKRAAWEDLRDIRGRDRVRGRRREVDQGRRVGHCDGLYIEVLVRKVIGRAESSLTAVSASEGVDHKKCGASAIGAVLYVFDGGTMIA